MTDMLDARWLANHPLPALEGETDKNSRGRVLVAGGATHVPGAIRLTGEAALRSGAGKLQMATVEAAAIPLGLAVPEAAVIALPVDRRGELCKRAVPLLRAALDRCDAFVLGPGMGDSDAAAVIVETLLDSPREGLSIVLDAAAIACADRLRDMLSCHAGRLVLTPHRGEMAALTGIDADEIARDLEGTASRAAARCGSVVALKGSETIIADPDGTLLHYPGGGVGLATGGSGDVLAGIIGGLLSRGASPIVAAAWGVWLHGEAGRRLANDVGRIGFLARELLPHIPALLERPGA